MTQLSSKSSDENYLPDFRILFFFVLYCLVFLVVAFQYMSGFGSEFATEDPRCPDALPEGQVTWNRFLNELFLQ